MRKQTAKNLAIAAPVAAAITSVTRSLAAGDGFGPPRPVAGALVAAVLLSALAQASPDIAGGLALIALFTAATLFPWQTITRQITN